jgi:hypothetical protein
MAGKLKSAAFEPQPLGLGAELLLDGRGIEPHELAHDLAVGERELPPPLAAEGSTSLARKRSACVCIT